LNNQDQELNVEELSLINALSREINIELRKPKDFEVENGHLTFLNLSGFKLNFFPENICNFRSLKRLNLDNNQIQFIPNEISNLQDLIWLGLARNRINKLPDSIGDLGSLKMLWLGVNSLTEIPSSIGNLRNLERLGLDVNELSKIPDEICNLTQLEWLNLDHNFLESLPDQIGNLSNLVFLNLSVNRLKKIPESIDLLKNIKRLYLDYNFLEDVRGWMIDFYTPSRKENLREVSIANMPLLFNYIETGRKLHNHIQRDIIQKHSYSIIGKCKFWEFAFEKIDKKSVTSSAGDRGECTVDLYIIPDENKKGRVLINDQGIQRIPISDRKNTYVRFQCVIRTEEPYLLPLVKNVVVQIKTNRGDNHELKFSQFTFTPKNKYEDGEPEENSDMEFQDNLVFKIDPEYSSMPEAEITISNIDIEYYNYLPFDPIKREFNGLNDRLKDIIISSNSNSFDTGQGIHSSNESSFNELDLIYGLNSVKDSLENIEWKFNDFKNLWKPQTRSVSIRLEMGNIFSKFGKLVEMLQSKIIFASVIPPVIVFLLSFFNLPLLKDNFFTTPVTWGQIFSYAPVVLIFIVLMIIWLKNQHISKTEKK